MLLAPVGGLGHPRRHVGVEPCGANRSFSSYKLVDKDGNKRTFTDAQRSKVARKDVCACLVASDPSPLIPKLGRHLTTGELLALQGYDGIDIQVPSSLTALQVASLIGNSFCGAVISKILEPILPLLAEHKSKNESLVA